MKPIYACCLLVGTALTGGCGASANSAIGGSAKSDASYASFGGGGAMGAGGTSGSIQDAGIVVMIDAAPLRDGGAERVASNLVGDVASFNWDTLTCSGCATTGGGTGTSGSGGAAGSSGPPGGGGSQAGTGGARSSGGALGSGGRPGAGGSVGLGGSSSSPGGASGRGGAAGGGGIPSSADAGARPDGSGVGADAPVIGVDATVDVRPLDSAGPGGPDSDASGVDARGSGSADAFTACVAQIVPVVPTAAWLGRLVAGANTKVVLRAQVVSGAMAPGTSWSWQATWDGSPLSLAALGQQDPNAALFAIANPGSYTFTATAGACQATVTGKAAAADACPVCDSETIVRAAPPATADIPVQTGWIKLLGDSPFSADNFVLSQGVPVLVAPSVGSKLVESYVRINDHLHGNLVVDGLAEPVAGGFSARLPALDDKASIAQYDVLVVPVDGATAPQLFQGYPPSSINGSFALAGGVTLTGTVVTSAGQPVPDVRVMLSNQDPASSQPRPDLLFSSVGRSDPQGNYSLQVQPGTYWGSFSPPSGIGLAEALSASPVTIARDASLGFQWDATTTASLALSVAGSTGVPLSGVSVRVSSSQSRSVGTLTQAGVGAISANGNVQIEGITDNSGAVVFANLPAPASYDLLLVPAAPDAHAATTTTSVALAAGGTSITVGLLPQATILGRLVAGVAAAPALDYASVNIVAYDRSLDTPEAPRAVAASPDGSFAFGVTPGRPYVFLAVPPVGSGYARTFVGPGPLQASEFVVTQNLQGSMPWTATVMDEYQNGVAETAMQVFCDSTWPGCVDPAVPLAETTSDDNGAFDLALPDPSTR